MSGIRVVADTNLLIYVLDGNSKVANYLDGKEVVVSFITELEILGKYGLSQQDKKEIRKILESCLIVDINQEIKNIVIDLTQGQKIKLPDAIIAATAIYMALPLLSADKSFRRIQDLNSLIIEL